MDRTIKTNTACLSYTEDQNVLRCLRSVYLSLYGSAGAVTEMSVSAMARGPTGLTTVFTGAMAIRAGAILSPCKCIHLTGQQLQGPRKGRSMLHLDKLIRMHRQCCSQQGVDGEALDRKPGVQRRERAWPATVVS